MRPTMNVYAASSVALAIYLAASFGLDAGRVLALDQGLVVWMATCLAATELIVMALLDDQFHETAHLEATSLPQEMSLFEVSDMIRILEASD